MAIFLPKLFARRPPRFEAGPSFSQDAVTKSDVFFAAAGQAFSENPIRVLYGMSQLNAATAQRFDTWGKPNPEWQQMHLTQEAWADSPFFREGLQWNEGMTWEYARLLAQWRDIEVQRGDIAAKGKSPIIGFAGAIAGSIPDPLNFVPFIGVATKARFANKTVNILKLFGRGGSASVRMTQVGNVLGRSLAEGTEAGIAVGLAQPLVFAGKGQFQEEFDAQMAFTNVMFASGISVGLGAAGRAISRLGLKTKNNMMARSVTQYAEGRNIQVIKEAEPNLRSAEDTAGPYPKRDSDTIRGPEEVTTTDRPIKAREVGSDPVLSDQLSERKVKTPEPMSKADIKSRGTEFPTGVKEPISESLTVEGKPFKIKKGMKVTALSGDKLVDGQILSVGKLKVKIKTRNGDVITVARKNVAPAGTTSAALKKKLSDEPLDPDTARQATERLDVEQVDKIENKIPDMTMSQIGRMSPILRESMINRAVSLKDEIQEGLIAGGVTSRSAKKELAEYDMIIEGNDVNVKNRSLRNRLKDKKRRIITALKEGGGKGRHFKAGDIDAITVLDSFNKNIELQNMRRLDFAEVAEEVFDSTYRERAEASVKLRFIEDEATALRKAGEVDIDRLNDEIDTISAETPFKADITEAESKLLKASDVELAKAQEMETVYKLAEQCINRGGLL